MSLFSNDMRVANTAAPSFQSQANVGQYGWTGADQGHYNQLIQYVDECRKIWLNLEEKILYVETILETVTDIDAQVKYIEVIANEVMKWRQEVIASRDQINRIYEEVKPLYEDFTVKYPEIVGMHTDVIALHKETLEAQHEAASSEVGAKEWYDKSKDLYDDLKEGQVYRGTWDPTTNAYPAHQGTNSVWDVILPAGTLEHNYGGFLWRSGDRLLYVVSASAYQQLATGSGVASINGKVGAVTITAGDLGAVKKTGDTMTGELIIDTTLPAPLTIKRSSQVGIKFESGNNTRVLGVDNAGSLRFGEGLDHGQNPIVYHSANKPTPSEIGGVSSSGDTMVGNLIMATGDAAKLVLNNNSVMGSHNNVIMKDHGNGNVTLSASKGASGDTGVLFLGYNATQAGTAGFNTAGVRLETPLAWKSSHTLIDSNGKIPVQHVTNAMGNTGSQILAGNFSLRPTVVSSEPMTIVHKHNTTGSNAQGISAYSDGNLATRIWGMGSYSTNGVHAYGYIGGGDVPWDNGLRLYEDKLLTAKPLYIPTLWDSSTGNRVIHSTAENGTGIYWGNQTQWSRIHAKDALLQVTDGTNIYRAFHTGYVPTAAQVQAVPTAAGRSSSLDNSQGVIATQTGNLDAVNAGGYGLYGNGSTGYPNVGGHGSFSYIETKSIYSNQARVQTAWGYDGNGAMAYRNYSQNSNSWTPWRAVYDTVNKPDPLDIGAVPNKGDLSTIDLNSLSSFANLGFWFQGQTAQATSARNYPLSEAGSLVITPGPYGCIQEYTTFSTARRFVRGKGSAGSAAGNWYAWREISATAQPISGATVGAGWSNYGSGYDGLRLFVQGNVVHISGMVKYNAAIPSGSIICTLPVGYRPSGIRMFSVMSSGGPIRIDIDNGGNVKCNTAIAVTNNWVSLGGITFVIV